MTKFFLFCLVPTVIFADIGSLKKVVDGDTLYFYSHGQTVKCRIAWIDTPESYRNARAKRKARECPGVTLGRMEEAGKEATRHVKQILSFGKTYHFDVMGHDRYGRAICIVKLPDGGIFNERMVIDGYAVPYWKYIPAALKRRFWKFSDEAKQKQTGLWKDYRPVMDCLSRRR